MTTPKLDDLLAKSLALGKRDNQRDASEHRVLTSLSAHPLPPQRKRARLRLPDALLDWNFAPAWPRIGVLATAAFLGFMIGLVGLDGQVDILAAASADGTTSQDDLGAVLFDAVPITGWHL